MMEQRGSGSVRSLLELIRLCCMVGPSGDATSHRGTCFCLCDGSQHVLKALGGGPLDKTQSESLSHHTAQPTLCFTINNGQGHKAEERRRKKGKKCNI